MIRKLLCWLGWHEWERYEYTHYILFCEDYKETREKCKHCGKAKR